MGKGSGTSIINTSTNNNALSTNEQQPQQQQNESTRTLCLLSLGVIFFFAIHNYLQEAIMKRPNFVYGWSLGLLEMYGTCFFSFVERSYKQKKKQQPQPQPQASEEASEETKTIKPAAKGNLLQKLLYHLLQKRNVSTSITTDYIIVSLCLASSSSLSSIALNYINFPTKVVFRSCKLLPTMAIAVTLHKKGFTNQEWSSAILVCVGLTMVGLADAQNLGDGFNVLGIVLVSASVLADAITPNIQQRLFDHNEQRPDVIYATNFIASIIMTVALFYSGDLQGALYIVQTDSTAGVYMMIYACVAYVAVSFHMTIVQKYGGVVGVLVGNGRKVLTIVLSFVLFPKPVSVMYVVGVACSLGGLTAAMVLREQNKKKVGGGGGWKKNGTINRKDSDLEEEMKSLILSSKGGLDENHNDDVENGDDGDEEESWFEGRPMQHQNESYSS